MTQEYQAEYEQFQRDIEYCETHRDERVFINRYILTKGLVVEAFLTLIDLSEPLFLANSGPYRPLRTLLPLISGYPGHSVALVSEAHPTY
jgi:hypothetical protein